MKMKVRLCMSLESESLDIYWTEKYIKRKRKV
jgi:hypothetical protein